MQDDKPLIFIIDDKINNLKLLYNVLEPEGYNIAVSSDPVDALESIKMQLPDLILLDVVMPVLDGYEVCKKLKENSSTSPIPVIFVTSQDESMCEHRGLELGAVDYLRKPINENIVKTRVKNHLKLYKKELILKDLVEKRTEEIQKKSDELKRTRLEIINRLGIASEFKDNETGNHVLRMSNYCLLIARKLELPEEFVDLLKNASQMHDVGKIGIPDEILLKNGPLTDEESSIMKQHPEIGSKIIGKHSSQLLKMAAVLSLTHHERWDGSGYPKKLKGEKIPIEGRIAAVADVFDALTSKRPYKPAWSMGKAVKVINEGKGTQFDPKIVDLFNDSILEIEKIYKQFSD